MRRVIPLFSLLPTDKQMCFVTHHPPLSAVGRRPVRCGWLLLLLQIFPMCLSYPTYSSSACQNSAPPAAPESLCPSGHLAAALSAANIHQNMRMHDESCLVTLMKVSRRL